MLRLLDANANRAREAARTLEDAARFLLDDAELSLAFKTLRHDLSAAFDRVPNPPDLPAHRDTPRDVGTAHVTAGEATRTSAAHVARAAGARLTEALRVLEEFGKLLPAPPAIEPLRYRAYELERRVVTALRPGEPRQWTLCVLLTRGLCRRPWTEVLDAALRGGADCLQIREKDADAADLLTHTRRVMTRVREAGSNASVFVNDRPDVAVAAGAHGVHLGQDDLPCVEARRLFGRRLIVGVSTADLDQAKRAYDDGADYCGVGPMFATTTKHKPVLAGPAYLRDYVRWQQEAPDRRPAHLAIGGVTADRVPELVAAGGRGVAVTAAVCAAEDPAAAVRELVAALPPATGPGG